MLATVAPKQSVLGSRCCAAYVGQSTWGQRAWCNPCGAIGSHAELEVVNSTAGAVILPAHPQLGLQSACGSDC
eukprot:3638971-Pyramimonas_sp.AAC.1